MSKSQPAVEVGIEDIDSGLRYLVFMLGSGLGH
jgi:hypothetical protein